MMKTYVKPTMVCIAIRAEESIAEGGSPTCYYITREAGNCEPGYYGLNG